MVLIKNKNGTINKIKINKDIIEELLTASKNDKEVDEVMISRVVTTMTEPERAKLKDLCTKYKVDVQPLDRHFIKHKIFIREDSIKEAFKKLIFIKTAFTK